jgi:cytidylate kinase
MSSTNDVRRFLDAIIEAERYVSYQGSERRALPFITISRQAGAGGHTLPETLLRVMGREQDAALFKGWQIWDKELCETLCQDPRLAASMQSLLTEEYRSQIEQFITSLLGTRTDQNLVYKEMFEMIRSLASVGKVIIVGRGGSQVTRGIGLGVHVRLVAPESIRVQRMKMRLGKSEEEALQIVHKQDRDRARLVRTYFHADIDDPLLYDVTWNTGTVTFEAIAEAIVCIIKERVKAALAESGSKT